MVSGSAPEAHERALGTRSCTGDTGLDFGLVVAELGSVASIGFSNRFEGRGHFDDVDADRVGNAEGEVGPEP
jgi:hypothetical protein